MDVRQIPVDNPLTKYLNQKASAGRIPINGTFELSPLCNFSCRMCYVRKTSQEVRTHDRPVMTLEDWLRVAEEAREQGMLYLLLTGGEPLLWPDFWELYEKLVRMGFFVSVNTNGSLIDETVIRRFRELPPARINLTLYGACDETYEQLCGVKNGFSRVDRAIRGLREAGIQLKLNCSLTPQNAGDLEAMVRYAEEKKLILTVTTYMFPPMRRDASMVGCNDRFTPEECAYYHMKRYRLQCGEEQYEQFLHHIMEGLVPPLGLDESCIDPANGKLRCRAGNAAFWITWDGWMTPCGMMPEPKAELMGRTFREAWEDIAEQCRQLTVSGVCEQCQNRQMCHSCAAMSYSETGSFSGVPTYLCQMVQAMKEIAAKELAEGNYAGS